MLRAFITFSLIILTTFATATSAERTWDYFLPDGYSVDDPSDPNYPHIASNLTLTLRSDRACLRSIRISPPNRRALLDAVENCNRSKWSDFNYWTDKGFVCKGFEGVTRRPSTKMINHLIAQAGGKRNMRKGDLDFLKSADTDWVVDCYR